MRIDLMNFKYYPTIETREIPIHLKNVYLHFKLDYPIEVSINEPFNFFKVKNNQIFFFNEIKKIYVRPVKLLVINFKEKFLIDLGFIYIYKDFKKVNTLENDILFKFQINKTLNTNESLEYTIFELEDKDLIIKFENYYSSYTNTIIEIVNDAYFPIFSFPYNQFNDLKNVLISNNYLSEYPNLKIKYLKIRVIASDSEPIDFKALFLFRIIL